MNTVKTLLKLVSMLSIHIGFLWVLWTLWTATAAKVSVTVPSDDIAGNVLWFFVLAMMFMAMAAEGTRILYDLMPPQSRIFRRKK